MGKTLIYGGSGGIGSAISHELHAQGRPVHLAGRNEQELSALAAKIGAGFTLGNVTDAEFFERATADAGEDLSGLVYAVGNLNLAPLQRLTPQTILDDFRVHALGASLAVKAAATTLKKSSTGASVLLFSSIAARQGFKMHASVAMAKGAIEGLTVSLAAEFAPHVRVNAIAPSLTKSKLSQPMLSNETLAQAIAALHPAGRIGEPEDLAPLAALLLSDRTPWITGQVLGVDGGRSTLRPKG